MESSHQSLFPETGNILGRVRDSMLFYEKRGNALVVRLSGDLDHSAATRLRGELDGLIEGTGAKKLVLDVSDVPFMDSSGIGLVIGRYKRMSRRGGSTHEPEEKVFSAQAQQNIFLLLKAS